MELKKKRSRVMEYKIFISITMSNYLELSFLLLLPFVLSFLSLILLS